MLRQVYSILCSVYGELLACFGSLSSSCISQEAPTTSAAKLYVSAASSITFSVGLPAPCPARTCMHMRLLEMSIIMRCVHTEQAMNRGTMHSCVRCSAMLQHDHQL